MRGSRGGRRPRGAVPGGCRARKWLAPDAGGRGRRDDRDEPSARERGRARGVPRGWQRRRRRAGGRRRAHRGRADRQRSRWRRVRHRLARRGAPRAERLRALAGPDRRAARRRDRSSVGHRAGRRPRLGRPRRAVRPARPRPCARARRGARVTRRRLHRPHRAQVVARGRGPVPRARAGGAVHDPRPRRDAPTPCRRRAGRLLPRPRRRGDRRSVLARGGRPRRAPLRVGRAAPLRLPRDRGLRAPAERAGGRSAPRSRALRRARAGAPLADRGDEARPRRRPRLRRGRAVARRAARPGAPRRTTQARRPGTRARAGPVGASSWGDDLPVRRRRRRDRDLAHPERLRDVRLGDRRARNGRRPPESRRGIRRDRRPSQPARARDEGRSTRSSPGCSSRAVGSSGRSA